MWKSLIFLYFVLNLWSHPSILLSCLLTFYTVTGIYTWFPCHGQGKTINGQYEIIYQVQGQIIQKKML